MAMPTAATLLSLRRKSLTSWPLVRLARRPANRFLAFPNYTLVVYGRGPES